MTLSAQLKSICCKEVAASLLLAELLLWSGAAKAHEYQSTPPEAVHVVSVHVGGDCCAGFYLSTQVGHLENGVCQYQRETPRQLVSGCDVYPFGVFKLNGKRLEELVGHDWNCAATHLHVDFSKDYFDRFVLIQSPQHHYVNSFPSNGDIHLSLCH